MSDIAEILAKNIKARRRKKQWSQHDLAHGAKISVAAVQAYEAMRRWPERPFLEAIAKALTCKPEDLFAPLEQEQAGLSQSLSQRQMLDVMLSQASDIDALKAELDTIKSSSFWRAFGKAEPGMQKFVTDVLEGLVQIPKHSPAKLE